MTVAKIVTVYTEGQAPSKSLTYLHADHLNTPRIGTDVNETIVWRWDSDAFGQKMPNMDPDNDTNLTFVNLRFLGQIKGGEASHYYNYFRDYDPSTGRYLESDLIGLDGGVNTFGYVFQNPVMVVDPLGLDGKGAYSFAVYQYNFGADRWQPWDPHPESKGRLRGPSGTEGRFALKCNFFVWDALTIGGDAPGRMPDGRVPSAGEWADPKTKIPGYSVLPSVVLPKPGDVIAYEGHVGIYVPLQNGAKGTISAAPFGYGSGLVYNDWGFRSGQKPTVRRCDCDLP